jgi:hypothetical protein
MSNSASTTVLEGKVAKFSVSASGIAPPLFQWTKNGAPIGGATKSKDTTPATTLADNGALFAVKVTNRAESVTSNNAVLTVQ